MDSTGGQVPAAGRTGLPLFGCPAAAAATVQDAAAPVPAAAGSPRIRELSALLGEIGSLRLSLQTDLTLAAAALEAGADELAGELVDADLNELWSFAARAAGHLARLEAGEAATRPETGAAATALDAGDAATPPEADVAECPATVPLRRRRRLLSAGPLLAAAAAVVGFVVVAPARSATAPGTAITNAATAGYELNRLAQLGATDEELREAAEELNDELAALIARAAHDPAAARQALMLLQQSSDVLSRQGRSGLLRGVRAEVGALRERLRGTLPADQRPGGEGIHPFTPALPRAQEQPEKERPSRSAGPRSSAEPGATPSPTFRSTPPATPASAPEPADEASPQPSSSPQEPLTEGVPGV
ncbi:MAG: hypothetical protein WD794_02135 [Mycobacteriales bacterium]